MSHLSPTRLYIMCLLKDKVATIIDNAEEIMGMATDRNKL